MKKIYTIDVMPYPTTYTIEAESMIEAKEKAKEWFYIQFDGKSVYETNIVDIEEVKA